MVLANKEAKAARRIQYVDKPRRITRNERPSGVAVLEKAQALEELDLWKEPTLRLANVPKIRTTTKPFYLSHEGVDDGGVGPLSCDGWRH